MRNARRDDEKKKQSSEELAGMLGRDKALGIKGSAGQTGRCAPKDSELLIAPLPLTHDYLFAYHYL